MIVVAVSRHVVNPDGLHAKASNPVLLDSLDANNDANKDTNGCLVPTGCIDLSDFTWNTFAKQNGLDAPGVEEFILPNNTNTNNNSSNVIVDEGKLMMLLDMGFGYEEGIEAMRHCNNDVEAAAAKLLSGEPISQSTQQQQSLNSQSNPSNADSFDALNGSTKYQLQAAIIHYGSSPQTGHYVAVVRGNQRDSSDDDDFYSGWLEFDDQSVNLLAEAKECRLLLQQAYLYLFSRVR